MLIKFILISVISLCSFINAHEQERSVYDIVLKPDCLTDLEQIEHLETLLKDPQYKHDFLAVKKLLNFYQNSGVTKAEMARAFGCPKDYISDLFDNFPIFPLITAVHKYFAEGGESLVLPPKPKKTVSEQFWGLFGWSFSSSSQSSRAATPDADDKQFLLDKKDQ